MHAAVHLICESLMLYGSLFGCIQFTAACCICCCCCWRCCYYCYIIIGDDDALLHAIIFLMYSHQNYYQDLIRIEELSHTKIFVLLIFAPYTTILASPAILWMNSEIRSNNKKQTILQKLPLQFTISFGFFASQILILD